jgi:hypothetical protein
LTVVGGEGIQFRPERFEVWGPENDDVFSHPGELEEEQ